MTDHELDTLIAGAATFSDADVAEWTRNAPFEELCEEIMSTTPVISSTPVHDHPTTTIPLARDGAGPRRPRYGWGRVASIAAAAAAVVALGLVVNLRGGNDSTNTAWAAELVEFAERSPLILMDDPDWTVAYADESGEQGEMRFTDGDAEADLHWRAGPLSGWLDDRLRSGTDRGSQAVVNGTATIVQYDDSDDYTALWEADGRVLEFRTRVADVIEFQGLLDSLAVVDVDTWLTAMPASVVEAADQSAVITEMLAGVPAPDGFEASTLAVGAQISDRYQLGARVVGAVSCSWIDQWIDATAAGDRVAAQEAVDAMGTSGQWPIIQEMNESGAYGQVLQAYVDAMTDDPPVLAPGGPTVAESYEQALGCGQ